MNCYGPLKAFLKVIVGAVAYGSGPNDSCWVAALLAHTYVGLVSFRIPQCHTRGLGTRHGPERRLRMFLGVFGKYVVKAGLYTGDGLLEKRAPSR